MNSKPCIVCGPSGVGKNTLLNQLMKQYPNTFGVAISHTTRQPRPGEKDGVDYNYITREEFEEMIANNGFLEYLQYPQVNGNYYGTSITAIDDVRKRGLICILDIAVQAAKKIKDEELVDAYYLFITCDGTLQQKKGTLEKRLMIRNTENKKQITKRINAAEKEFAFVQENDEFFESIVSNDDLEISAKRFSQQFESWYPSISNESELKRCEIKAISLSTSEEIKQLSSKTVIIAIIGIIALVITLYNVV